MTTDQAAPDTPPAAWTTLPSGGGLRAEINVNGTLRRLLFDGLGGDLMVNLFPANALEPGPTQLVLRRLDADGSATAAQALLGPQPGHEWRCTPTVPVPDAAAPVGGVAEWRGRWGTIAWQLQLRLAADAPVWFWHLSLANTGMEPTTVDLLLQQDLALAPVGAVRLNEYYVSHYIDHSPLAHGERGTLLAVRQNQAVAGRCPWALLGSLRQAVSYATDAVQVYGQAGRLGQQPAAWRRGLPGRRLQQEHSMAALQDAPLTLAAGQRMSLGFFGGLQADHPAATEAAADAPWADFLLTLPEARPLDTTNDRTAWQPCAASFHATTPLLAAQDLTEGEMEAVFGPRTGWLHVDRGADGRPASFFTSADRHMVLRAKELQVMRPHGQLLRSGDALVPDETALTSTVWMGGVFHSMVTQGHVSINRLLSGQHGMLGLFRSQGLRLAVEQPDGWRLLDLPSAFGMRPGTARWLYRHVGGLIEVQAHADAHAPALSLKLRLLRGTACRVMVLMHLALNGDDGEAAGLPRIQSSTAGLWRLEPADDTDLARRFPGGGFVLATDPTAVEAWSGDELLWPDGRSRGVPMCCLRTRPVESFSLTLHGALVEHAAPPVDPALPRLDALALPHWTVPGDSAEAAAANALATALPWFRDNALVHYLAPRGLEQYSGGGWGTRDVSQGPVELLLGLGCHAPVRDLLLKLFAAQRPDGDWPQWFMFFDRDAGIRAGDSHGDIVFWPVLALAQYLLASGDGRLLAEEVTFFGEDGPATVQAHVDRALQVIGARCIAGTALAAYGHGDWNDSLQPADPELREHLCSAWTVTLHHQTLATWQRALRRIGRAREADALQPELDAIARDFQQRLMPDGVVCGYALFDEQGALQPLVHPADERTGLHYSVLPMIHAITARLFSAEQARAHLALIRRHLHGPDGARLFDRPLDYRGGPQRLFQRAESATYFGREIGLMYTHAHLRYAEALAEVGDADGLFAALGLAHPVDLAARCLPAAPRQANCYYSSSDGVFADRAEASAQYGALLRGEVSVEGGWRVYSSGAGIFLGLVTRCLLGLRQDADGWLIDPVLPAALDGLSVRWAVAGRPMSVTYRIGALGHGPTNVRLNGTTIGGVREAHPYRKGGLRIARAAWDVAAGHDPAAPLDLEITLG